MATSTNNALALRAVKAANLCEHWIKELISEMEKQNIKLDPAMGAHKEKVATIRIDLINNMILSMAALRTEIRKFDQPKGSN